MSRTHHGSRVLAERRDRFAVVLAALAEGPKRPRDVAKLAWPDRPSLFDGPARGLMRTLVTYGLARESWEGPPAAFVRGGGRSFEVTAKGREWLKTNQSEGRKTNG